MNRTGRSFLRRPCPNVFKCGPVIVLIVSIWEIPRIDLGQLVFWYRAVLLQSRTRKDLGSAGSHAKAGFIMHLPLSFLFLPHSPSMCFLLSLDPSWQGPVKEWYETIVSHRTRIYAASYNPKSRVVRMVSFRSMTCAKKRNPTFFLPFTKKENKTKKEGVVYFSIDTLRALETYLEGISLDKKLL